MPKSEKKLLVPDSNVSPTVQNDQEIEASENLIQDNSVVFPSQVNNNLSQVKNPK